MTTRDEEPTIAAARSEERVPDRRTLVLVPTYNERDNLPLLIQKVRAAVPAADVLVLDDNSPDGTGDVADQLAAADPHVSVLHRTEKAGLGAAYLAGFDWGLQRGYELLVEIDADGSHPPTVLPTMLRAAEDADVVIGSRYVPGGSVVNWPMHRQLLSRGGNLYIKVLLSMPVNDATAGYRVYRATALHHIGLDSVSSTGYCFQTDLTWRATRGGLRVREVPITFVEREIGESKMNPEVARESLVRITGWGIGYRAEQVRNIADGAVRSIRRRRNTKSSLP
ncbi:polyprenol monophosphomannose synthase [Demetria terragena]|uniref:polyprenol monophosphomannose synthase n=1 Tax=Demetria terragena TaxID=63959 RepID=UPI000380B9F7|nr:polyprenol monophosphomannose synthase [Demetria terragena]